MKKVFNIFDNKRNILGIFLLGGLVFNTYKIQENSNNLKKMTNLENGIQTCFQRVNQTYTAKLLGDKVSQYLAQNFQNLTEECFAEALLTSENIALGVAPNISKQLTNLASNVHWFHEDILAPGAVKKLAANSKEGRNVGNRFEKIETTKEEILDSSAQYKNVISSTINNHKNIFYISSTILLMLMLAELMAMAKRRMSNAARELEAGAELSDQGGIYSVRIGEIIKVALEQNEMIRCSQLFTNYYSHNQTLKLKTKNISEMLVTPTRKDLSTSNQKEIDELWADDAYGVSVDSTQGEETRELGVSLELATSNVVDLMAERLFSHGIQIDMNIPQAAVIAANQEEIEQSLYYLFSYAINASKDFSAEKSIGIVSHKLGEIVTFDMSFSGTGFDSEILKQRVGLDSVAGELELDLKICQGILNDLGAKVQLDNKIDQSGEIVGSKVKLILKGLKTSESSGKLVDLKVGTKQEILKSLRESSQSNTN